VGSVMASKLREKRGPERINTYSGAGAIAFFNDYVEMYRADPSYPRELRFTEPFEKILAQWHQSWGRTYTEYVRRLAVTPDANLDAVNENLRKTFSGAEVYPSLIDEFFAIMRTLILRGEREKSLKVGKIATDLYPRSDVTNTLYAVAQLSSGDKARAQELLKKAVEINAEGIASAGGLNSIAYQLAGAGRPEEGIELLKLAVELHPREANLYDSIGEFYLNTGQKEKAVEYYRKALEVNPNFENAKRMLEKITK
jgi:tetratricopeptide (TPR) repeat protein